MTKTKLVASWIVPIIIVAVASLGITATIIHNIIEEESVALQEHKKTFKLLLNDRDGKLENIVLNLKANELTISEYVSKRQNILQEYEISHKQYVSKKQELMLAQSYLGYTSYKNFLLGIGIRLFTFIVCLFYFSSKIKQHYTTSNQKVFFLIISSSFVLTSAYWLTWSLIYKVNSIGEYDFEHWHQNVLLVIAPILILASSYFLFKHYQTIEEKFKKTIKNIFRYIYESKEDLKEDKKQKHTIKRGKLISETIENVG